MRVLFNAFLVRSLVLGKGSFLSRLLVSDQAVQTVLDLQLVLEVKEQMKEKKEEPVELEEIVFGFTP